MTIVIFVYVYIYSVMYQILSLIGGAHTHTHTPSESFFNGDISLLATTFEICKQHTYTHAHIVLLFIYREHVVALEKPLYRISYCVRLQNK